MRWLLVILLSIISILFLEKGIELWIVLANIDGEGIGISFLGTSIIEKVFKDSIPGFALGFTISALIPLMVAINIALKSRSKESVIPTN